MCMSDSDRLQSGLQTSIGPREMFRRDTREAYCIDKMLILPTGNTAYSYVVLFRFRHCTAGPAVSCGLDSAQAGSTLLIGFGIFYCSP